jgi:TRAP-type C4-dicarboxylate transport system permease small subunit
VRERFREFLGVYAPLIVGVGLIVLAVNSVLTAPSAASNPWFPVDPLASAACGGLVVIVGAILILSTLGRWRKVRAARRQ